MPSPEPGLVFKAGGGYTGRMDDPAYLSGQFLLATPGMRDPRFARAAIAMCAHDANGALGIGVGQVIEGLGFHDLLAQFDIAPGDSPDAPVHRGGPVEPQRGFVLHSGDWGGQDTVDVAGRWQLSGSLDVLKAIAGGTGPTRWLLALGYAGWGAGQLDGELAGAGWLNVPADAALLFDTPAAGRWDAGLAAAGIDARLLVGTAGRA